MKKILLTTCLLCMFYAAHTQNSISTDRPDMTETSAAVEKGTFQFETGFTYDFMGQNSVITNGSLLRFGVLSGTELRLDVSFSKFDKASSGVEKTVLWPIGFGFKTDLRKQNGIIPEMAVIGSLSLNKLASKSVQPEAIAPNFALTMSNAITEKWSIGYNLGMMWDGHSIEPHYVYTLATGVSLNETIGVYAEVYGFLKKEATPSHWIDGGFTFKLNKDMQIDISGGTLLSGGPSQSFISAGFSFRINSSKEK